MPRTPSAPETTSTGRPSAARARKSPGGSQTAPAPVRRAVQPSAGAGPSASQATRPVRASSATSFPSDHRLTTVVPSATTPLTSAGQRRYDQYG